MVDKISWIFFHGNPMSIASYMLSGIFPADYLKIKKEIFLEKDDPTVFLDLLQSNILIFGRPFHKKAIELAREAKKRNIKIITTCDDWHFIEESKMQKILYDVAFLSDAVVVKTKTAAEIAKNNTGLNPYVISDCLGFQSRKPINKINYPFKAAWFGKHMNLDTLYYGILEMIKIDLFVNLKIFTNFAENLENFKKKIYELNLKKISIEIKLWSLDFDNELDDIDIIIIPYIYDKKRVVKSLNRITDSMNLGKLVVTSRMPFNLDLEDYCVLGNIGKGLLWTKENQIKAIQKATLGNEYVKKNFTIEKISNNWLKLINKLQ